MGTLIKNGVAYGGGSGGTTDYEDLSNLPSINGTSLVGNKTSAELGIITKAVDDLVNYYTKSTTYSKSEVDDIVLAIKNSRFEAVSSLPTTNIKTNVIYLVPKSSPETSDVKDEYINLDGTTSGWELIGSTEIDLSNYVTVTALNTALADYTTTANLTTLLNAKQDKVQVSTMPTASADYVGKGFYQFMGVTDSTYTHGYFYECVNNGGTYSWSQVNVQPSSGGGGGGHTIEDSEGTALTQRDILQFKKGFVAEDDDTNEKTVISPDVMQSGDMSDVITPLPSVQTRYHKYSTSEQVVGEWIDASPIYEKSWTLNTDLPPSTANPRFVNITINGLSSIGIDNVVSMSIIAKGKNDYAGVWLTDSSGENLSSYLNVNDNKLQIYQQQTSYPSAFTVIAFTLQYTKTTT